MNGHGNGVDTKAANGTTSVEKPADPQSLPAWRVRRATRTRKTWALVSSAALILATVFLILVEVGNTHNEGALRNIYFINLNLANVVATSIPVADLSNTIARTLGLYDFYQVGLWNYCEGYDSGGIQRCSNPTALYWFNPIGIISSQILAGATIVFPSELHEILNIIKIASQWMFGLFITGTCLSFVLVFITPLSTYSRWPTFLITLLTFLNALFVTAASVVATVMFIIMRDKFNNDITEVNIKAKIGTVMFAFMWIASACAIFAFVVQLCLTCCCASRRDIRKGKKRGSKRAYM